MRPFHLRVRDLTKQFVLHILHGKRVLGFEGVSFDVAPGSFVGLAGQSGSGKSSLLKAIYRTYLVDSGAIEYRREDGQIVDLATVDDSTVIELRQGEIGYVSQFLRAAPRVSALDLVSRPLIQRGVNADAARTRAMELLGRLQLPRELWDGYPALFSGGEQQRVNLARAIAARPRLLLLDEPTSALDGSLQGVVIDMLAEERAQGVTMIGVMHDTDLLGRLADQVVTLHLGRMVATTTAA